MVDVIVNATALESSGALTILKQFLTRAADDYRSYICFVPEEIQLPTSSNIQLIRINKKSWIKRIIWDSLGLKLWLKKNKINFRVVISLQNTTVNVSGKQIVYLHQPLPFSNVNWNLFKKEEFIFYLYKKFYHFFIGLHLKKDTVFIVQTNWMKKALNKSLSVENDLINVIKPDIQLPDDISKLPRKSDNKFRILYPATPIVYKNHFILLEALKRIKERRNIDDIMLILTFKEGEYKSFYDKASEFDLLKNISFIGVVPYEELISEYSKSDLVVFPSYIETLGLPLLEAAALGKNVICSDEEYSRDVLHGYKFVSYANRKDSLLWADLIEKKYLFSYTYEQTEKFSFIPTSSWNDFFKILG